jgi:hypothetical protein
MILTISILSLLLIKAQTYFDTINLNHRRLPIEWSKSLQCWVDSTHFQTPHANIPARSSLAKHRSTILSSISAPLETMRTPLFLCASTSTLGLHPAAGHLLVYPKQVPLPPPPHLLSQARILHTRPPSLFAGYWRWCWDSPVYLMLTSQFSPPSRFNLIYARREDLAASIQVKHIRSPKTFGPIHVLCASNWWLLSFSYFFIFRLMASKFFIFFYLTIFHGS